MHCAYYAQRRKGRYNLSLASRQGANVNPTSTLFGQVTSVALNQMRFFTFGARMTF
jgi:hypothetical protein